MLDVQESALFITESSPLPDRAEPRLSRGKREDSRKVLGIFMLLFIIYLAFISLGLPDSLLGSAWPVMYRDLGVPLSYSGIVFMIIALGTVVSSLASDRVIRRLGTGRVTAISVCMTAAAIFGFSVSSSFILLCFWAIPYGLGAGSVDAALNNYVALHFESRHMSWLHCMWGVGASAGPMIMGMVLSRGEPWNGGYRTIALLQVLLTVVLFFSLPLWHGEKSNADVPGAPAEITAFPELLRLPGTKATMASFFCYCAIEQTASLWASSYLVMAKGLSEVSAARCASLFFIGITIGRAVSGFITLRLNDDQMVRLGQLLIAAGLAAVFLPAAGGLAFAGFILIGLGCAPIYPCMIHATPEHFGRERSQAVVGLQMASAYVGTSLMPPLFGLLTRWSDIRLLPVYMSVILCIMVILYGKTTVRRAEGSD